MKILASSQVSIAKDVADYAVDKYEDQLAIIGDALSNYDETIPVDDVLDQIRDIIYRKYFNHFKKTKDRWGGNYGTPSNNLDECLADVDKWWHTYLTIWGVAKTRSNTIVVDICTQFVDFFTDSYYAIYDFETQSAEIVKSSASEYKAKTGKEELYDGSSNYSNRPSM